MRKGLSCSEAGKLGAIVAKDIIEKLKLERINEYLKCPNKCKNCENVLEYEKRHLQFCNHNCSATFSNKNRDFKPGNDNRTKQIECPVCKKNHGANIRASFKTKCTACKAELDNYRDKTKCLVCGMEICSNPEICGHKRMFKTLSKTIGFDLSTLGSQKIIDEYNKSVELLKEEYEVNELSLDELCVKYHFKSQQSCNYIITTLGIIKRNLEDSVRIAYKKGRAKPGSGKQYKYGWHADWQGKEHFYRSSYELDFYLKLDLEKKNYETESLRIEYFDSQENKKRIAVPDILLVDENEIIEIKSEWTYDEQNMKDKFKSYKELGFHGYVFLEKIERIDF